MTGHRLGRIVHASIKKHGLITNGPLTQLPLRSRCGRELRFPIEWRNEKSDLSDPYIADRETLFSSHADDTLNEFEMRSADSSSAKLAVFNAVDEFLGPNRKELRKMQWLPAYKTLSAKVGILESVAACLAIESIAR